MVYEDPVIFYDGHCRLCNFAVGIVIRHDREKKFRFSSLQSEAAAICLPGIRIDKQKPESIVYRENEKIYRDSTAVLRIFRKLGGWWYMLYFLIIVPAPLRDMVYRFIARNRYKWFGQASSCPVIPPESRID